MIATSPKIVCESVGQIIVKHDALLTQICVDTSHVSTSLSFAFRFVMIPSDNALRWEVHRNDHPLEKVRRPEHASEPPDRRVAVPLYAFDQLFGARRSKVGYNVPRLRFGYKS